MMHIMQTPKLNHDFGVHFFYARQEGSALGIRMLIIAALLVGAASYVIQYYPEALKSLKNL